MHWLRGLSLSFTLEIRVFLHAGRLSMGHWHTLGVYRSAFPCRVLTEQSEVGEHTAVQNRLLILLQIVGEHTQSCFPLVAVGAVWTNRLRQATSKTWWPQTLIKIYTPCWQAEQVLLCSSPHYKLLEQPVFIPRAGPPETPSLSSHSACKLSLCLLLMLFLQITQWLWPEGWDWPGSIQRRNCWVSPKWKWFETSPASPSSLPPPCRRVSLHRPFLLLLAFLFFFFSWKQQPLHCLILSEVCLISQVRNSSAEAPRDLPGSLEELLRVLLGRAQFSEGWEIALLCIHQNRPLHHMDEDGRQCFQAGNPVDAPALQKAVGSFTQALAWHVQSRGVAAVACSLLQVPVLCMAAVAEWLRLDMRTGWDGCV